LKIAYQKNVSASSGYYDSSNEPGLGGSGKKSQGYCHQESLQAFPADSTHAETLTVNYPGVTGNTLYFVNPWMTATVLESAVDLLNQVSNNYRNPQTNLYMYAVATNTFNYSYRVQGGTTDLTWYSTDHIDGVLIGLYYPVAPGAAGKFYPVTSTMPVIAPGTTYYAIFKLNEVELYFPPPYNGGISSMMFWGTVSLTTAAMNQTYFAGTLLSSGLWIRGSC
jgi:hypothetical protein